MRIGLNLLHAMPEIGGGWNYITRLVESLGQCDEENGYVAFVTEASAGIVPCKPNFKVVQIGLRAVSRPRRVLYENTALHLEVRRQRLDVMHWFANTIALAARIPGVVTVYDLQVFENPQAIPRLQRLYLQAMFPQAVRRAALLLPISNTTARALQCVLHAPSKRIQVVPPIVGEAFHPARPEEVTALRRKYNLPDDFWLYVAHFYPHKNHLRLLYAYRELQRNGFSPWPLVLRGNDHGGRAEVVQCVAELGLEKDVCFVPPMDEAELPALYSAADGLVFPSLYEGAGIPLLEAMACGCPVIASDISVVREFGGDSVIYFDPLEVALIGNALRTFQEDAAGRAHARELGLARVREYRPDRVVESLTSAYRRAALG